MFWGVLFMVWVLSGEVGGLGLGLKGWGFWRLLFFVFVVMVWDLSGMMGGGWFWGAEGLGLRWLRRWGLRLRRLAKYGGVVEGSKIIYKIFYEIDFEKFLSIKREYLIFSIIPIKGYGLDPVFALRPPCRLPRLLFRSIWLLVRALQGDPENSGNFQAFCSKILGILGITRI